MSAVAKALIRIERALNETSGNFLLGEYTQADVMMTAHFHRLEDVGLTEALDWDVFPQTKAV